MTVELLRTLSKNAKGSSEGGIESVDGTDRGENGLAWNRGNFHLVTRQLPSKTPPSLLTSSKYRDAILEFVNILRTKGYKYKQITGNFSDPKGNVCAMGLYGMEKKGDPIVVDVYPFSGNLEECIWRMNDVHEWTFTQIADELERGVSIIQ